MGLGEYYGSYNKSSQEKALLPLFPDVHYNDIKREKLVRAQAYDHKGRLIDDFLIVED